MAEAGEIVYAVEDENDGSVWRNYFAHYQDALDKLHELVNDHCAQEELDPEDEAYWDDEETFVDLENSRYIAVVEQELE